MSRKGQCKVWGYCLLESNKGQGLETARHSSDGIKPLTSKSSNLLGPKFKDLNFNIIQQTLLEICWKTSYVTEHCEPNKLAEECHHYILP